MRKLFIALFQRLMLVIFFLFLALIISTGSGKRVNYASNIGNATSLQATHFVTKYDNLQPTLEMKAVSTMDEVAMYGPSSPVSFTGEMTAYIAKCPGCSGRVACPPRRDVTTNIYYEDENYGTLRILAADGRIPCGSILKITNVTFTTEAIYGIVLDRGSAITNNIVDLLTETVEEGYSIGRQSNVQYEIIRWGW